MADPLRFSSFDDVERALATFASSAPTFTGAWPLGTVLSHCAQSIECSLAGYPKLRSALFRATIGRFALRRFLRQGFMSHDLAAPIAGAPTLDDVPLAEGATRLRLAIAKFRAHEGALHPHLAFGPLTKEEYERVHAMHFANHVSPR